MTEFRNSQSPANPVCFRRHFNHADCATALLCLALLSLPAAAQAQFGFATNNAGLTITSYTGSGGSVVIPSSTNGLLIVGIGDYAFYATTVSSVSIPNSVTNIGVSAFSLCDDLATILVNAGSSNYSSTDGVLFNQTQTQLLQYPGGKASGAYVVPASVTTIADNAFAYCNNLLAVTIPATVTNFGNSAFQNCGELSSATLSNGIPSIGNSAFENCSNLISLSIPGSVSTIGTSAFDGCLRLAEVDLTSNLASIGQNAFNMCVDLTNVSIPGSVTNIGFAAFGSCDSLAAISVDMSDPAYTDLSGVLFDKNQTALIQCPGAKTGDYALPSGLLNIEDDAFMNCARLTSVNIPSGVTNIGNLAFENCTGLAGVAIPDTVFNIGIDAFYFCTNLGAITIPNSVTNLGTFSFYQCLNLTNVTLSDGLTNIGTDMFAYCGKLNSITIPNHVTSIGNSAFFLSGLTSLALPNGITNIGEFAFAQCANLTLATLPATILSLNNDAFATCPNLSAVYFAGNAPNLGPAVFPSDNNLTIYYLPAATGWGATFGTRPTVQWNPWIKELGFDFGIQANEFGFGISGNSNLVVNIEVKTNLADAAWLPLQSVVLVGGAYQFTDPDSTNSPARFYRLALP